MSSMIMIGTVRFGLLGLLVLLALSSAAVSAHEELVESQPSRHENNTGKEVESNLGYKHVWPEIRFSWKIAVGTMIAFVGAAFGSVGGVGGGGFFIPMLTLIIGFDQKSAIAVSKCMITGTATSTVVYNLRRRHPTLELPIIDYDLALLFQPVLVLGISIGVSLNVVLSDWMITILLFVVLLAVSTKSFFKGVKAWKAETVTKKIKRVASEGLQSNDVEDKYIPGGATNGALTEKNETKRTKVSAVDNVRWKELGALVAVWLVILALQIAKTYVKKCSGTYWLIELLQIPVAVGVTSYQAVNLYKGRRVIASKGEASTKWPVYKLIAYCAGGIAAGILGGLLGLGGAFMLGPLFLEMGIPPQVSSATATFAMTFSSSMSVVEYYLLKRFPVPYALYFAAVTTISAVVGQHVAGKVIKKLGRASLIIFVLASTIFVSSVTLGGIGVGNMVKNIEQKKPLGFQNICTQKP
ncbi:hypothetical protein ACFX2I_024904 [Malus domestica]|nr:sulfite exporter TauE/SafE family protein 3-like [Malus domestica]